MGIFDALTGKSQQEAANQQRLIAAQTKNENTGTINNGLNASLAALGTGYGNATGGVNQGYTDAMTALNGGRSYLDAAGANLGALTGKYGGATTTALNALGVNGPQGQADARATFQAGPAYNFNLDQGLEAINRRRAAGGMLASGNADRDAQTFGAGLASNEYDKWMNQLLGFTNPEVAANVASSQNARDQLGLSMTQANAATQRGAMLADLDKWYAGGQAGLQTGAANSLVGNTNQAANVYNQSYKNEADAKTAASGNMINLGMNLAKLAAGAAGGMPGLGGGGGSFSGLGGNPNMPMAGFDQSGVYYNYG